VPILQLYTQMYVCDTRIYLWDSEGQPLLDCAKEENCAYSYIPRYVCVIGQKYVRDHRGRKAIAQMQYKSQLFAGNSKKKLFYLWQTARL
jgi:hypothetical protein